MRTAWIGVCHLRQADGGEYRCQAAVWAHYESFRATLEAHVAPRGYTLIWLEDVLPAAHYISDHTSQHPQVGALVQAVHSGNTVELGPMQSMRPHETIQPESYLTIEDHAFAPLPDQTGIPFWDRDWIAPELKELLFGQPEDGQKLRTYLIVDATLRKNVIGTFDLDDVDVPVQCLFKGTAAEELKESAPYLIDMTLPDDAWDDGGLVPAFHKSFFAKHWGQNTGIFIRTTARMSEVWGHFRKFTLVPRAGQRTPIFVRFWDEQYMRLYFPHIANNRERVERWFMRDGFCVHALLADQDGGKTVREIVLQHTLVYTANTPSKPFEITEYDLAPFSRERERKDLWTLAEALKKGFPKDLKNYSEETILSLIEDPVHRMVGYGFRQQKHLYILAAWSLFFGQSFEHKDPSGRLSDICKSPLSEIDKMSALKARMEHLSAPKRAAS
ncbi:hypothetical protein CEW89_03390 [Celeribacter ethanolicus]|uniref:DUF4123 domain-containing protein n=1 Tax=Celeribacter ethanolicus TaxID=1758178 RepID=A0A291G8D6_9RHOB|nr:DUF4123 domain-containing protein [Celeribacter ethanolicus]ATG46689.1 hypothetical protein CEW89_03390 [Celeribacter ethanolicus]